MNYVILVATGEITMNRRIESGIRLWAKGKRSGLNRNSLFLMSAVFMVVSMMVTSVVFINHSDD